MKKTVKDVMDECKEDVAREKKVSAYTAASRMVEIGIIYEMSVTDFFCALDNAKSIAMAQSKMQKRGGC